VKEEEERERNKRGKERGRRKQKERGVRKEKEGEE